eukprot:239752-Chlamydomonas_euryale.AAC.8
MKKELSCLHAVRCIPTRHTIHFPRKNLKQISFAQAKHASCARNRRRRRTFEASSVPTHHQGSSDVR